MNNLVDDVDAVYIHIPFCNNICAYCDFCKIYYNKKIVISYLKQLELEIKANYNHEEINTLYIGGGTPSSLDIDSLEILLQLLSLFNLSKDAEITFEANPDSLTPKKIKLLKKYGVNRISLGVETINESLGELLKRKTSKEKVREVIKTLKQEGISNINVDLIYGIKGEDLKILKEDLDFLISLDVFHISTYSLILEDNTILKIKGYQELDPDLDSIMYEYISNYLKEKGFDHYEISNFAKDKYKSKHNSKYWYNLPYYGFGLGASGYLNNIRYTNTKSITNYLAGKRKLEEEVLTFLDTIKYEIMLRLRLKEGIDKQSFFKRYHTNVEDIFLYKPLVETGYLKETSTNIAILEKYFYVSNTIIVKFLSTYIFKK